MQLIVLRHGATAWNEQGLLQGRADPPLSEAGRLALQSWQLPVAWRGLPCFVSPLRRARESAELLRLQAGRQVSELIEMDWGAFEGRRLSDLRAEFGKQMAANESRGLDFRPPGGESPRDVTVRLRHWLDRLGGAETAAMVVTHKGVRRAFLAIATGWDMRTGPPVKIRNGDAIVFDLAASGRLVFVEAIPVGPPS